MNVKCLSKIAFLAIGHYIWRNQTILVNSNDLACWLKFSHTGPVLTWWYVRLGCGSRAGVRHPTALNQRLKTGSLCRTYDFYSSIADVSSDLPTLLIRSPERTSRGLTARMTNISFQPYTNPMTIPAIKAEIHWKNIPSLSPIPVWIWVTSLGGQQDDKVSGVIVQLQLDSAANFVKDMSVYNW